MGCLEQVNPGKWGVQFQRTPDLAKCPLLFFKHLQRTWLFCQAQREGLSFEMPRQSDVCVLVAGGGCCMGKPELPLEYADQCWHLAGQDKGSDVIIAVDVPSQTGAVQTSSPPFSCLIGIRRGNAHASLLLYAWIHTYMVCFELTVLHSEPESV